jgi:hypothetical protein
MNFPYSLPFMELKRFITDFMGSAMDPVLSWVNPFVSDTKYRICILFQTRNF